MGNQAAFLSDSHEIDGNRVRGWFSEPVAVEHYARAVHAVGLWKSEQTVFCSVFSRDRRILDIGCGAGRVALGLWRLGYQSLTGVDFCEPLVEQARRIAAAVGAAVPFAVGDACALRFGDGAFEGAIFAFNGLMQIPVRAKRRQALRELARVVVSGGYLVFTTHDIARVFRRMPEGAHRPDLSAPEGVDRVLDLPEGTVFMHIPTRREILDDLDASGWEHCEDHMRSSLANESQAVREFADECRFWIVKRR